MKSESSILQFCLIFVSFSLTLSGCGPTEQTAVRKESITEDEDKSRAADEEKRVRRELARFEKQEAALQKQEEVRQKIHEVKMKRANRPTSWKVISKYLDFYYGPEDRTCEGATDVVNADSGETKLGVFGCVQGRWKTFRSHELFDGKNLWKVAHGLENGLRNQVLRAFRYAGDAVTKRTIDYDWINDISEPLNFYWGYDFGCIKGLPEGYPMPCVIEFSFFPRGDHFDAIPDEKEILVQIPDTGVADVDEGAFVTMLLNGDSGQLYRNAVRGSKKFMNKFDEKMIKAIWQITKINSIYTTARHLQSLFENEPFTTYRDLSIVWVRNGISCAEYVGEMLDLIGGVEGLVMKGINLVTKSGITGALTLTLSQLFGGTDPLLTQTGLTCSKQAGKILLEKLGAYFQQSSQEYFVEPEVPRQHEKWEPDFFFSSSMARAMESSLAMFDSLFYHGRKLHVVPHIKEKHLATGISERLDSFISTMSMIDAKNKPSATISPDLMKKLHQGSMRLVDKHMSETLDFSFMRTNWKLHSNSANMDYFYQWLPSHLLDLLRNDDTLLLRKHLVIFANSHWEFLHNEYKHWCGDEKMNNNEAYVLPYQLWLDSETGNIHDVVFTKPPPVDKPTKKHCNLEIEPLTCNEHRTKRFEMSEIERCDQRWGTESTWAQIITLANEEVVNRKSVKSTSWFSSNFGSLDIGSVVKHLPLIRNVIPN